MSDSTGTMLEETVAENRRMGFAPLATVAGSGP